MSSSKSNTSQATNQLDNRRVIGENGISAENSTVNVQTLDGNVIAAALQAMGGSGAGSLTFGSDALNSALGFGGEALDAARWATEDALGFADSTTSRASNLTQNVFDGALSFANSTTSRATNLTQNVFDGALDANAGVLSKAFTFGTNALDRSFAGLADTQNLVADAYSDAKGRGALTDKILIGAIAAMAVVAFAAVGKK